MTEQSDTAMVLTMMMFIDVILFVMMFYVGFIPILYLSFALSMLVTFILYVFYRMDKKP
jgi:hypothetical protein